jgi:hypothetical protein
MNISPFFPSIAPASGKELSRLLTAAVINRRFCNLLLTSPAAALASGYHGEPFRLATEEKDLVLSIQARSLEEFAMQLAGGQGSNRSLQ